jgi:outer membrane protein assembly factor BamA
MQLIQPLKTTWIRAAAMAGVLMAAAPPAHAGEPMTTGEVRIYGNRKIKTYIIRREIPLRTGEPFDQAKLSEARERISEIPGVDYSEIRVSYAPADSSLSLSVVVTEKSTFTGFPIIQRGYENKFSFGMWVADENFRGRSEKIGASVLFRGNTVLTASWENPWLGQGPRIGVGVDGRYIAYDYVYDDLGGLFEGTRLTGTGADVSLFYTFAANTRLYTRLGYLRVDADSTGATIKPDHDQFGTVALGVRHDGRGSVLFPWSGWFLEAEGVAYGPGEEAYSILEGRLDGRVFLPVFDRTVFGLQLKASVKDGDEIPIYLREHLGGGWTIRSYDYGTFHGVSSIVGGAEFRIPINFNRRRTVEDLLFAASFHLFADAGAAWELDQSPDDEDLWHGGFGIGFHVLNAWVKGIRVDYAWHRKSNGRLDVEIGAKF